MTEQLARRRLPDRRYREAFEFEHDGHRYRAEIGRDVTYVPGQGHVGTGAIGELFLSTAKTGAHLDAQARDSGLLFSLLLQYGCPVDTILAALTRDNVGRPAGALGRAIEIAFAGGRPVMIPHYCCGFLRDIQHATVLLVRKRKPDWQAGLLNGIGGKIESDETPLDAMIREWSEEVGFEFRNWRALARLDAQGSLVHFFAASGHIPPPKAFNDVGEALELIDLISVPHRTDIIANLKWLLPMAFADACQPFADVRDAFDPRRVA